MALKNGRMAAVLPLLLAAWLAACDGAILTDRQRGLQNSTGKTPVPSPSSSSPSSGLTGQLPAEDTSQSSPTPKSTGGAVASPAPTATPTPGRSPSHEPYLAYSVRLTLAPATASINLPGDGTAGYSSTIGLHALVLMSDASTTSAVAWSSSKPQYATVSAAGVVTAVAVPEGGASVSVDIWAETQDRRASASCRVEVGNYTDVDLTIR